MSKVASLIMRTGCCDNCRRLARINKSHAGVGAGLCNVALDYKLLLGLSGLFL